MILWRQNHWHQIICWQCSSRSYYHHWEISKGQILSEEVATSTVFSKRVLDTLEEGIPSVASGEKKMGWTIKKHLHWGRRPNQGRQLSLKHLAARTGYRNKPQQQSFCSWGVSFSGYYKFEQDGSKGPTISNFGTPYSQISCVMWSRDQGSPYQGAITCVTLFGSRLEK